MRNGQSQIPGLGSVAKIFHVVYTLENGLKVTGQLSSPRNRTSSDFAEPRRVLYTGPQSVVKSGDIIKTNGGDRFLVMDNGDQDRGGVQYRTFKVVRVTKQLKWEREVSQVDPVTHRSKPDSVTDLGMIWVLEESLRDTEDTLRIQTPRYRLTTNAALKVGDMVGGKSVKNVTIQLGISVAEVS